MSRPVMVSGGSGLIGSKIGEYEVVRRLGVGGMGAVYEGLHPVIGKRVAIKILHPHLAEHAEVLKRFETEARAVNKIGHRGIVDIFSFGQLEDGSNYFVMELLEGHSFEELIKRSSPLPMTVALGYFAQALDAVGAAHDAEVIHRDIKPSNLFLVVGARGRSFVKVLDFGIAKLQSLPDLTLTKGGVMGTPHYMAPEQVVGKPVQPQTDIYALGVVLFEMLTGQKPFPQTNALAAMRAQVTEPPPLLSSVLPGVPASLDALVDQMLRKAPEDRPASCEVVLETVEALLAAHDEEATDLDLGSASGIQPNDTLLKRAPLTPLPQLRTKRPGHTLSDEHLDPDVTRDAPALTRVDGPSHRAEPEPEPTDPSGSRSPPRTVTPVRVAPSAPSAPTEPSVISAPGVSIQLDAPPRSAAPFFVAGALLLGVLLVAVFFNFQNLWGGDEPAPVSVRVRRPRPPAQAPAVDSRPPTVAAEQTPTDTVTAPAEVTPPTEVKPTGEVTPPTEVKPTGEPHEDRSPSALMVNRRLAERRLAAVERAVAAAEKGAGAKDPILRRFLDQCRGQLKAAHSLSELARATKAIEELEHQIRQP